MTPSDFKAAFPAFKDTGAPTIQRWLDASVPFFNVRRWSAFGAPFFTLGVGRWVAHNLVVEEFESLNPMGGDESTKKVGSEMVQYDIETLKRRSNDPYQRTTYGRDYASQRDMVGAGGIVP